LLFLYLNLLYNKCDYKRYILESYLFYRITIINGVVIVGDARKMFLYIYIWMLDFLKLVIGIRNYHMIEVILSRYLQMLAMFM